MNNIDQCGEVIVILTKYVIYRGKKRKVEDLSPTSGYKVDVQCPECGEVRNVHYSSVCHAGHTMCRNCAIKKKLTKTLRRGAMFGRLTVLKPASRRGHSICQCECGETTEVANWNLQSGKTRSCGCLRAEHIKKVSFNPSGEDHWHWKGGVSSERHIAMSQKTYKEWRDEIFERDEYTCQKCGQVGGKLRAHHIFNYADHPKLRLDVDNGATLCDKCHRRFHRINGFKTNRDQLDTFLAE